MISLFNRLLKTFEKDKDVYFRFIPAKRGFKPSKKNIKVSDIDLVIPHQASITAIEAYIKYGRFNPQQIVNVISKTGNCVAASLPMSLAMAYKDNRISRGDRLYFTGTGAGLSIISALIKF